jgi:SOS response regulatory protein OraA/RecX
MAMRIDSVRKKASGSLEVAVSGGLLFCFDEVDAQLLELSSNNSSLDVYSLTEHSEGESIDEEMILLLSRLSTLHRARNDALLLISRAEQASRQLYQKLIKKGYEPEIAQICIRWICSEHYVDDRRYVRMLFQSHCVKRGQGPTRIQALAWPRIGLFENPQTILADSMASIPESDFMEAIKKNVESLLRKPSTFSRLNLNTISEKRSFLRSFLRRQGFPYQSVETFIETLVLKENKND